MTTASIYRGSHDPLPSLGVGFDTFLGVLDGDVLTAADEMLAKHGYARTGDWTTDTPAAPLTGLYTAPITAKAAG